MALALTYAAHACTVHKSVMLGSSCKGNCYYNNIAVGIAANSYFIGLGGGNTEGLLFEAKRNLFRAFPLRKGEFYDNYVIDYKTTYYPFIRKTQVMLSADVVALDGQSSTYSFSENYELSLGAAKKMLPDGINLADSVCWLKGFGIQKGIVIDVAGNESVILTNGHSGTQIIKRVPMNDLFSIGNEEMEDATGLESGQIVEYSTNVGKKGNTVIKEIIGLRKENVLMVVKTNQKLSYKIQPISLLKKQ